MARAAESIGRPDLRLRELVALAALASLFLRTSAYPTLAIQSASVRLQDLLFALVIALFIPDLLRWARQRRVLSGLAGAFAVVLVVAAVRSPAGIEGQIAVAKYLEFVAAGLAIGVMLRKFPRPEVVTAILVLAVLAVGMLAFADLLRLGGIAALATHRAGGTLGLTSAATAAGLAAIWCALRLTRPASPAEEVLAVVGLIAAASLALAAKSVIVVGAFLGLAAILPAIRSRASMRMAVMCGAVVLAVAGGRVADILAAAGQAERGNPVAAAVALPVPGTPPAMPLPFQQRYPDRLTGGSFVHRTALAYMGLHIAMEAPLLGHGWLATSNATFLRSRSSDELMLERFPDLEPNFLATNYPTASHNAYIQMMSETGVAGALLLPALLLGALVPGLVAVFRRGRLVPWTVACGAGWTILAAVFLTSSTLYGGQFEAGLLGMALGISGAASVRLRHWLAAAALTALFVGASLAFLLLPAGPGPPDPLIRSLAVDRTTGRQLYLHQRSPASRVELRNGIVAVRAIGDHIWISPDQRASGATPAPRRVRVPGLHRARDARVIRSTGEATAVEIVDGGGAPLTALRLVRGMPGVYMTRIGGALHVPSVAEVAAGRRFERILMTAGREDRHAIKGLFPAALEPADAGPVTVVVPLSTVFLTSAGDTIRFRSPTPSTTFFVGTTRAAELASPGPGAYLVARRGGRALVTEVVRIPRHMRRTRHARLTLPLVRNDEHRSGIAELASLGVTYRAWPPP